MHQRNKDLYDQKSVDCPTNKTPEARPGFRRHRDRDRDRDQIGVTVATLVVAHFVAIVFIAITSVDVVTIILFIVILKFFNQLLKTT